MRIKFIQKIIDKIRKKNKILIKGKNNTIFIQSEDKIFFLNNAKYGFKIEGYNNTVKFVSKNLKTFPKGLFILIKGNNNYIEIHEPNCSNSYIEIFGENNKFLLAKLCKEMQGASFHLADGGTIEIEKECELGNSALWVVVNGDYKRKHKLFIGEGTHIAKDTIIRTSDGECLLDYNTEEPISEPQDVYIGKHCWITSRCLILKGTYLPNNTIVAANSLVNKKFSEEATLIGGSPAKLIRNNVKWIKGSYRENMEKYRKE